MTNNWFECKVKYTKINENGKERKVTEPYLIDAISFTEAESRIHTELEKMIHGDFMVWNISRSNISEIFPNGNGDRFFKAKTTFVTVDEESGKEKKSNNYMLVEANNAKEAYEFLKDGLSDMIVPFEIPSVSESPIIDVFPFFKDEVNEEIPANLKPIKEVVSSDIDVVCVKEAMDEYGQRIMQFTEGLVYNATKVEDPEGWEILDDNENKEVFFDLDPMFKIV